MLNYINTAMAAWKLDDFSIGRILGKGSLGNVYYAQHLSSQKEFAIKIILKNSLQKSSIVHLRREIEIQSRLRHENILRLYGYFQDKSCLYILLEYMSGGDLYNYIKKQHPIPLPAAKSILLSISRGLEYLSKYKIIHRDIKPENILLTSTAQVKIADFGLCALEPMKGRRYSIVGTLQFMAPEMAALKGYDCSSDLWALGLIFHEVLCGHPPFPVNCTNDILTLEEVEAPEEWEDNAKDIYKALVTKGERFTIQKVISHEFFTGVLNKQ